MAPVWGDDVTSGLSVVGGWVGVKRAGGCRDMERLACAVLQSGVKCFIGCLAVFKEVCGSRGKGGGLRGLGGPVC